MGNQLFVFLLLLGLSGCISSDDVTHKPEAAHLIGKCFKIKKPSFVFESRCADLTGVNNNSELCNGIQAMGEGAFPDNWDSYLANRHSFDVSQFDRLAFEKQRTMLFPVDPNTKIIITRVVHHGWGTIGRYWVFRGNIEFNGEDIEVELPSFYLVHEPPYWIDGKSPSVPKTNLGYLQSCGV